MGEGGGKDAGTNGWWRKPDAACLRFLLEELEGTE